MGGLNADLGRLIVDKTIFINDGNEIIRSE